MTDALIPWCNDMQVFSPEEIKRAGELLRCPLDESSIIRALIIQRDTGLSLTRGEISIVPFGGVPSVIINKQGYLTYAKRQPDFDRAVATVQRGTNPITGKEEPYAKCTILRKDGTIAHEESDIWFSEFGKNTPIWKQMPNYMLKKTATSIALRTAYPVFNGTYSEEEVPTVKYGPREGDIEVEPAIIQEPVQTKPPVQKKPEQKKERIEPKPKCRTYLLVEAEKALKNMKSQGMNTDIFEKAKLGTGEFNKDMIDADFARQLADKKAAAAQNQQQEKPAASVCPNCGKPSMTPLDIATISTALEGTGVVFDPKICRECALKLRDEYQQKQQQQIQEHTPNEEPKTEQNTDPENKQPHQHKRCVECGTIVIGDEESISMRRFGIPLCKTHLEKRLNANIQESKNKNEETKPDVQKTETEPEPELKCSECGKPISREEYKRGMDKFGNPLCPECWIRSFNLKKE